MPAAAAVRAVALPSAGQYRSRGRGDDSVAEGGRSSHVRAAHVPPAGSPGALPVTGSRAGGRAPLLV